jgi:NAD(P)-dependent dehydrogenase (short-subunit alcohol dehydrogenase family)
MDSLLDFSNKVALITGAAQGFGKMLAQGLAERGAKLVLGDIQTELLAELGQSLTAAGHQVVTLPCDVSKNADCQAMVAAAVEHFGRLDIAVNNAGIAHEFTPLHQIDEALMDRQFAINVKGVQFGMAHQINQMLTQEQGVILNVSSMAGLGAAPRIGAYSAAKHAVVGLTRSGAVEYATNNIRINAICPFFSPTNMVTELTNDKMRAGMAQGTPMQRLAEPQEVVAMMVMMLSPANSYMTGQCIAIDGGMSAK